MREGDTTDRRLDARLREAGERWRADHPRSAEVSPVPSDPVVVVQAPDRVLSPDGRVRRWSRRRQVLGIAAVAVVAAAVVALLIGVLGGSPVPVGDALSPSDGGTSARPGVPPDVVRSSAVDAIASETVRRLDQPVEWVRTTAGRLPNRQGIGKDTEVYVVQISGSFVCNTCKGVWTSPPTGSTIILEFAVDSGAGVSSFTLTDEPYDLSVAGDVQSFVVEQPSATTS